MKEKLFKLKTEALKQIKECDDNEVIEKIRVRYLGKKGELTSILRSMGTLSAEERPEIGKLANDVRAVIENEIKEIKEKADSHASEKKIK